MPDAVAGNRAPSLPGQRAERHRRRQCADPADPAGRRVPGDDRHNVVEAEHPGEHGGGAGLHHVRVGVRGDQRASAADQPRHHRALVAVLGDGR